jgi:hypothetical protein
MDYFDVKAVSNSKIGEWKKMLRGEKNLHENSSFKGAGLLFGTVFHAIIAGEDIQEKFDKLKPHERFEVMKMAKKIHKELGHIITKAVSKEQEYTWVQEFEGVGKVKCKAKTDLVYQDEMGLHCVDFKTTAADSYEEFLGSVMTFDYHRQAAWYFLADKFQTYTIIGVSKSKSHDIFILPPFTKEDLLIEVGLQECIEVMQEVRKMNQYQEYFQF